MRAAMASLSLLLSCCAAFAEETVREISWATLAEEGKLTGGEAVAPTDATPFHQLRIESSQSQPKTVTILTVGDPGITGPRYALVGQVRYEGVEGQGYLEMLNHFPGAPPYFTKACAPAGPLKCLSGSSDWRPFVLPFFVDRENMHPTKLVVNVVLPGKGTVYIGPPTLKQYGQDENPLATAAPSSSGDRRTVRPAEARSAAQRRAASPTPWWTQRAAGWIGGIVGASLGCLGALIGLLASRGSARRFVLGLLEATVVVGIVALVIGVVALVSRQPYHVFYPPLLVGIIGSVVPLSSLRTLRKRYEQMELRKMEAMDAT